jgi:hypothetical protein
VIERDTLRRTSASGDLISFVSSLSPRRDVHSSIKAGFIGEISLILQLVAVT